jgi:hypothetical protein
MQWSEGRPRESHRKHIGGTRSVVPLWRVHCFLSEPETGRNAGTRIDTLTGTISITSPLGSKKSSLSWCGS